MAKGDDIEERLIRWGIAVLDMCEQLPKTKAGSHIATQLTRSSTAAGPNYAEARGSESLGDFIHKLGIALKELNESRVWLKMIRARGMANEQTMEPVARECEELCRIIAVSRRTAQKNCEKREQKMNC